MHDVSVVFMAKSILCGVVLLCIDKSNVSKKYTLELHDAHDAQIINLYAPQCPSRNFYKLL